MRKRISFILVVLFLWSVSTHAAEINDGAEVLGYEILAGYGLGTAVGLSGYLIHKDCGNSWMPRMFAYTFPAGAAAGVLLMGELKGETATNGGVTIAVTAASAYLSLLIGELLGAEDGRALGVLFSVPAATAAYNYVKKSPEDKNAMIPITLSFSLYM